MTAIRVLVVDDSAFMRRQITSILEKADDIVVIGSARNGEDAVQKVTELVPDVVTLDISMPVMNGLSALATIMMTHPTRCVMLSSLTQDGAPATLEALELGAIDFVGKPSGTVSLDIESQAREIVAKVRMAARAQLRKRAVRRAPARRPPAQTRSTAVAPQVARPAIVAIGVSTGGPQTLMEILPELPADFPAPIVVVQHIPARFTAPLAKRLDDHCALKVTEAKHMELLRAGTVYVAPGGIHLTVGRNGVAGGMTAFLSHSPEGTQFCPSVDVLFNSVAAAYGSRAVGVLLTGMGSDGADGMLRIHDQGGTTIAESEQTAVVFGMPHEAIVRGAVDIIAPCTQVANHMRISLGKLVLTR
jgi:two-component system chemotaxis response regulator CheB